MDKTKLHCTRYSTVLPRGDELLIGWEYVGPLRVDRGGPGTSHQAVRLRHHHQHQHHQPPQENRELLKGVCQEIFDLQFFLDSNPSGPLINRLQYIFRIRFRFCRNIRSQSCLRGVQHTAEINCTPRSQIRNLHLSMVVFKRDNQEKSF